jgi:hypothetical protein
VVEVVPDDEGNHWVMRVVERGPFATVRVVLDALLPRGLRLMKTIEATGCSFERMNASLFAVFGVHEDIRQLVGRLGDDGYRWEYVNPKREDVASSESSAAVDRLVAPDIDAASQVLIHLDAAWKERADDEVEVHAKVDVGKQRPELLPARRIDDRLWELCSSPFLASGFALGDVVNVDQVDDVSARLVTLGCVVERRPRTGTLAVDSASPEIFDAASTWLAGRSEVLIEVLQAPRRIGARDIS